MDMKFLRGSCVFAALLLLVSVTALGQENTGPSTADRAPDQTKSSDAKLTPPRVIYAPDPEYSLDARKHHVEGVVVLALTVGADGTTSNIKVRRSLRPDLDNNAIEAVKHWKFEPSTKNGEAVAVNVNVEVNFRLLK